MLFENISPFVRFCTKQKLFFNTEMVNLDHRLYYCLNGEGTIFLNGQPFPFKKNTLLLWKAGTTYTHSIKNPAGNIEIFSCNFDYSRVSEKVTHPVPPVRKSSFDSSKLLSENYEFTDNKAFNDIIYIENAIVIKEFLHSLCLEFSKTNKYRRLKINNMFADILYRIAELHEYLMYPAKHNLVNEVLSYLQQHYVNEPSLKELSTIFSYHPNYINSLVQQQTGVTIHRHIINIKMNKAIELLITTDLSIGKIAENIGMKDQQYFSRLFKQHYKVTPSEFRENK